MNLNSHSFLSILKRYWGYDDFRGIQRDIIESIAAGHDTLGLMPTGGGKSVTFQVPALAMEGVCVVITPLIALMKDQVEHLRQRGIFAAAIYSGLSHDRVLQTLENCIFGKTKILYVSPERLGSELFQTKLRHIRVSFITVDEAHCISQWGYDFRPSYLQIANIRSIHPDVPILALTATATLEVVDDIQERLAFREHCVFRMSFERKNIAYVVRHATDKRQQLLSILQDTDGSSIVYVRSRRHAKEISDMLCDAGLSATFFHAGLDHVVKDTRQKEWQQEKTRIIVATNAFGMGIDKPNVRMVVHFDCPDSIESYFQEAGRAGRDGQQATAILLYNAGDHRKLEKRIADTFPEKDYIRKVYDHLAYYYQIAVGDGFGVTREFNIDEFCHRFGHFPLRVDAALKILQRAGYLEYEEEPENASRVMFLIGRDELYRLDRNTPDEERVIVALLRNYGGLFADFCFIDEALLSQQTSMQPQQVYLTLKALHQKHLIYYIPRKNIPHVRYLQRREESKHLLFPAKVYEERKTRYAERIRAMLGYATNDELCRSRQLLRYFGEQQTQPCGHCDVCLQEHGEYVTKEMMADARQSILLLLADGKRHHVTELLKLRLHPDALDDALTELLQEEYIYQDLGFLYKA